jgi:SAM-dependent methyltransferase
MSEIPISPLTGTQDVDRIGKIPVQPLVHIYAADGFDISADMRGLDEIVVWQCRISGLKFTVPCITGSADFYAQVEKAGSEYAVDKFEFSFIAPLIAPGARVLDVGCGFGNLAAHISSSDYTGLEFSDHAATRGREYGRRIISESIQQHAVANAEQYDVVVSFQVLEHVQNPRDFLAACATCLRPGGRMIIGVPSDDSFPGISVNDIFNLPPHHVTFWPDRALRYALANVGLQDIAIEHEPLAPEHLEFYVHQILLRMLAPGGTPRDYVRTDLQFRLRNKLAFWLGKMLRRGYRSNQRLAVGHSVVGIAAKPIILENGDAAQHLRR